MDGGYIKTYKIMLDAGSVYSMLNKGIQSLFGAYIIIFAINAKYAR